MATQPITLQDGPALELEGDEKSTLISLVNFNSGGKKGRELADQLIKLLGKDHVFNLAEGGPAPALKKFAGVQNLRIAVCGGDGTVNWVLATIRELAVSPVPAVGIIPMGTGNDAARAFGWGSSYSGEAAVERAIEAMHSCPVTTWDRWHVQASYMDDLPDDYKCPPFLRAMAAPFVYDPRDAQGADSKNAKDSKDSKDAKDSKDSQDSADAGAVAPADDAADGQTDGAKAAGTPAAAAAAAAAIEGKGAGPVRQAEFQNYFSFGVDAQIIHEFHEHRESHRELYCCRCMNMTWMGIYGFLNFCCCQSNPMHLQVETRESPRDDWAPVKLPDDCRGLVLLNLQTYAGGRVIWGTSQSKQGEFAGDAPSFNDGRLELVGIRSSFHLGLMVGQLTRGERLGQARELRITCQPTVVQIDGEPWAEQEVVYHIRPIPQARMLCRPDYAEACC